MINIIKDFGRKIFIRMMRNKAVKCMPFDLHGRTLIIAPHPDDEVLGCGGLIAKLVADGNPPYIVILTGRGASHSNCCGLESESIVSERRKLTKDALSILNLPLENLFELDFKDGHISASDIEEIREFNKIINDIKPANILVPHKGEGLSDHLAAREIGLSFKEVNLYEYCVWMWYYHQKELDWHNGYILQLSENQEGKKRNAIKTYIEPQAPCGNPWSGVLPEVFIKACSWDKELYFKLR